MARWSRAASASDRGHAPTTRGIAPATAWRLRRQFRRQRRLGCGRRRRFGPPGQQRAQGRPVCPPPSRVRRPRWSGPGRPAGPWPPPRPAPACAPAPGPGPRAVRAAAPAPRAALPPAPRPPRGGRGRHQQAARAFRHVDARAQVIDGDLAAEGLGQLGPGVAGGPQQQLHRGLGPGRSRAAPCPRRRGASRGCGPRWPPPASARAWRGPRRDVPRPPRPRCATPRADRRSASAARRTTAAISTSVTPRQTPNWCGRARGHCAQERLADPRLIEATARQFQGGTLPARGADAGEDPGVDVDDLVEAAGLARLPVSARRFGQDRTRER